MDLDNDDFGYRKIVVERPLLNEDGTPVIDRKGNKKAMRCHSWLFLFRFGKGGLNLRLVADYLSPSNHLHM